jgi:hypothetical protein
MLSDRHALTWANTTSTLSLPAFFHIRKLYQDSLATGSWVRVVFEAPVYLPPATLPYAPAPSRMESAGPAGRGKLVTGGRGRHVCGKGNTAPSIKAFRCA